MKKHQIMGIVNATPDSFFDGDPQNNLPSLTAKCKEYVESGADILDIGGESTRPFAEPVPAEEELARVLPLLKQARKEWPSLTLSLDTTKIPVALEGLKVGVNIINDISGTPDKEMFKIVKDFGAKIVITHMRGTPKTMTTFTDYKDLIGEIKSFLEGKIAEAAACGIERENIIIDVGFGFAKNRTQNYRLLKHLSEFKSLGVKMLVGLSRKSFLSQPCEGAPKRKAQTLAANFAALQNGADILRVHDVKETRKIINFFEELNSAL